MATLLKLTNKDKKSEFDINKCIICQKKTKSTLVSTENGRKKIMDAAFIRKDEVYQRLNKDSIDQNFCYHMDNNCYKKYTLKKSLDAVKVSIL